MLRLQQGVYVDDFSSDPAAEAPLAARMALQTNVEHENPFGRWRWHANDQPRSHTDHPSEAEVRGAARPCATRFHVRSARSVSRMRCEAVAPGAHAFSMWRRHPPHHPTKPRLRASMRPDRSVVFLPNERKGSRCRRAVSALITGDSGSTRCSGSGAGLRHWRFSRARLRSRSRRSVPNMPTCSTQLPRGIISHPASVSADACQHPEGASGATA